MQLLFEQLNLLRDLHVDLACVGLSSIDLSQLLEHIER
jgi:hypothetical protein